MRAPTAISVNDDLAACEACIALGDTDNELPRRIDVQVRMVAKERQGRLAAFELDLLQGLLDNLLDDELVHLLHTWCCHVWPCVASYLLTASSPEWLGMLRRDNNSVNLLGLH